MVRWTRICRLEDIARPGAYVVCRDVELASGQAFAPDNGCVDTFAVKMERGVVYADLRLGDYRSPAMPSWGIKQLG
jgi:hypothetical protein